MSVRALYEEFPFPYRGNHGDLLAKYVVPEVPFQPASILDAGCGTGNITLDAARIFPQASVTGVDFSDASLERARVLAREAGATNVEFQRHDLLEPFPAGRSAGPHRLAMSIGCIHHTPDPVRCLRNLRQVVADDGLFVLGVYGKHGRLETELRRSLVDHIRKATGKSNRELLAVYTDLSSEPALAQNRLRKVPPLTLRFLAKLGVERARARLAPSGSLATSESTDVGDADQFLHPLVHNWTAKQWIEALEASGFEILRFVHDSSANGWCIPERPIERLESPELRELLTNMTLAQRYQTLDLLYRPVLHFIVCKPSASTHPS